MARDPNKPTRMDGILNNIPSVMDELSNRLEQTGRLREYSNANSKNPDKILEDWMRPNQVVVNPMEYPVVNLSDFAGRGFVLGESDRAIANRRLDSIGGKPLAFPIDLNTGSNFIFHNPQVWSSGKSPITKMFNQAVKIKEKTGQNPIMLPRLLGPQGVDFDKNIATTQLSYNLANAPTDTLKLQDDILRMFVPGWKSASDPASMAAFYELPADVRKSVQLKLDKLKNEGGLSLGNARVAITNPDYIDVPNQFLPAVAEIDVSGDITKNDNINYPYGLQGRPLGLLSTPLTAPELVQPQGELSWGEKGAVRPQDVNLYFQRANTSGVLDEDRMNKMSDAGVKFKSPGAVGIIAGTVAAIVGTGYSGQEVEAGVIDTAKKVVAADAKTTQRANTVNTAKSAAAYLKNQGASGKSLDYGAGHGINAKAMGFDETFEPFAGEGFTPTYTSGKDIPRGEYGQIVSTNVLNVIPPTDVIDGQMFRPRDMAVLNIGDALQDGGMAVIQTRSASAVNELKKSKTAIPQDESGAFVTSRGSYQKGFTRPELQEYVQGVLGDGFGVEIVPAKDISAGSAVKVVKLGRFNNLQSAVTSAAVGTGLLGTSEESDASVAKLLERGMRVVGEPDPRDSRVGEYFLQAGDDTKSIGNLFTESAETSGYPQSNFMASADTFLADQYRGQGIAQELYDAVEEITGNTLVPSEILTADGARLWASRNPDRLSEVSGVMDEAGKRQAADALSSTDSAANPQSAVAAAVLGTGLLGASEESEANIVGSLSKLGAGRQDLLGMAKKMANEGMDRDRIWWRTGWELGADGQWKTELPNTKTKINIPEIEEGRQYYAGTIADIVDDPELLSQYETGGRKPTVRDMDSQIEEYGSRGTYGPLGDIEFIIDRNMPANQGYHREGHFNSNEEWSPEVIVISGKSSPAEQRATVLHELQHAIQDREGFASGGAARNFETEERIRDAFYDGVGLTPAGSKRLQELEAKSKEVGQGSMSIKELNELERLKVEKQIADRFNVETVGEAGARSPYGMYQSLMGEVEARNVEYRDQTFSDLGLRDTSPYYSEDAFEPRSQQIFRAGSDDELTKELAYLDLPNFRSDASSLDDDFARMQQNADGGIVNQMMAKNARSQQLAKYGDALKSRREAIKLKDTTRKLLDVDRPGILQLGTEFAMRGAEDLAKVIVGATGSLFSPDSGFYEKVSGSDSVFGNPSEAYEDVTGAIAAGLEKYVVPELKEAFAWKGDSGRSINDKVDKTVQDVMAAYTSTPQSFQDSVTPRLPYAATLVLSAYGLGAGKAALQGGKRIVGEPGGPGILGRLNPLEGELVMPEGLPNRKPIGLLQ